MSQKSVAGVDDDQHTQARSGGSRRSIDMAQAAVVCLGLIFSLCFIAITPPFWGNDNASHYGRAYQVAHGGLLPQSIDYTDKPKVRSYGGELPNTLWRAFELADKQREQAAASGAGSTGNPAFHRTAALDKQLNARLHAASGTETVWFNNTAVYSPVPYLVAAAGIAVVDAMNGTVAQALFVPTLLNALFFIACAWLAVRMLKDSKWKWLVVAFTLFPPNLAQSTSALTADTCTNALCMLLFALLVKGLLLRQRLTQLESILLAATAVLLPLCKPTYGFVVPLVLLIPAARIGFAHTASVWLKRISVLAGLAAWCAWTLISSPVSRGLAHFRSDYWQKPFGTGGQLKYMFFHPWHAFELVFKTFVDQDDGISRLQLSALLLPVSPTGLLLFAVALVLVVGSCERVRFAKRSHMWLTVLAVLASVGSTLASIYCTFNPVGNPSIEGVYARYFFPITPFVMMLVLANTSLRFAVPQPVAPGLHAVGNGGVEARFTGAPADEPAEMPVTALMDVPGRSRVLTVAVPTLLAAALICAALKYYGQIWG